MTTAGGTTRTLLLFLGLASVVLCHGYVDWPPAREAGEATAAACGAAVQKEIVRDNTSHIEGLPEIATRDKTFDPTRCNLWYAAARGGVVGARYLARWERVCILLYVSAG